MINIDVKLGMEDGTVSAFCQLWPFVTCFIIKKVHLPQYEVNHKWYMHTLQTVFTCTHW